MVANASRRGTPIVARLRKAYVATAESGCANPWLSGRAIACEGGLARSAWESVMAQHKFEAFYYCAITSNRIGAHTDTDHIRLGGDGS